MNNNFDDLLREKWEEKQFPVDPEHRQQMLDLLEKNDRRKFGYYWWIGGMAIAVVMAGLFLLMNRGHEINEQPVPTPNQSTYLNSDVAQSAENSGKEISKDNETLSVSPKTNHVGAKDIENKTSKTNNTLVNSTHQNQSSLASANKPKNHSSSKHANDHVDASSHTGTVFQTAPNVNGNDPILVGQHSPIYVSGAVAVVVEPDDEAVDNSVPVAVKRNENITQSLAPLSISDLTMTQSDLMGQILPSQSGIHSFRLYMETGAGFIPSVKNEYSAGWTFNAGGALSYKLGSRISLLASLGYLFQNGGFNFERTSTVQNPGFGVRSDFNVLMPDKLHFVYSKLGMQYGWKRNLVSIYGGLQWLYGAQGSIVIRTADQFADTKVSSRYTWLSTDGMRQFLWNSELLYGYRLTPRMIIRGGMKYYFSSIDAKDTALSSEGYYWKGNYSSFTPSLVINYQLYGNR